MKVFESKFTAEDISQLDDVFKSGQLGFGPKVLEFEQHFKSYSKKKFNVATNSASAAAFMIFAYLKKTYGVCDVYTPSLAFTSPAWAAKHFGHNIIWIDVNDSLLFDCDDYLQKRLHGNRQPVLMPILYGGVSNINNWITNGDEIVIVDSAHCITPTINYDFAFFSFHPYKPICSSDGGMISTNDDDATNYFCSYRNFGRHSIDNTYDIIQEGFKFYMNNLNATIALISSKKYFENLKIRKENFNLLKSRYNLIEHGSDSSFYFATSIIDKSTEINNKYNLARHYPMLHKTSYFDSDIKLDNTERLHNKITNLPLWYEYFK